MRRKEVLFAVIGGVVGAVLVMAGGAVLPLGAENEVRDAEFGKINCRGLDVVDEHGETMASMRINEHGGKFWVFGKDDKDTKMTGFNMAGMGIDKDRGWFTAYGNEFGKIAGVDFDEHGGRVYVFGKGVSKTAEAAITVDKYGNGTVGTWDKNGNRLATLK